MFDLAEELERSTDPEQYDISDEFDVEHASAAEIKTTLNIAIDGIARSPEAIVQPLILDIVRSLLKHSDHLQPASLNSLLDSLTSGFQAEIDATVADYNISDSTAYRSHKEALETYAFVLHWFIAIAERTTSAKQAPDVASKAKRATKKAPKKKNDSHADWTWASSIPEILALMGRVLGRLRTSERIWQTTQERDTFISCFIKSANRIAESETHMKSLQVRQGIYKILCLACKNHGHAFSVQTTISQNLAYTEHLAEYMAEVVALLAKEFDYPQTGEELLREISAKKFSDKADAKISKSFSRFLVRLSEVCPRVILKQISLLTKLFDVEAYQVRMAMIEVIGNLIKELSTSSADLEDGGHGVNGMGEEAQQQSNNARQIEGFFDVLCDRFRDVNGFVRSKNVQVLIKLMDLPRSFPPIRLKVARLAARSLSDKSSIVRKNCMALLNKMVQTHPYYAMMHLEAGMQQPAHDLNATEWKKRYEQVVVSLKPFEEAVQSAAERFVETPKKKQPVKAVLEEDAEEAGNESQEAGNVSHVSGDGDGDASAQDVEGDTSRVDGDVDVDMSPEQLLMDVDQDQLTRLQYAKRYYADARTFIKTLEDGFGEGRDETAPKSAVEKIIELLNSTTKSEVLEAMEFLTVASHYKMESAEEGIKAMLHLVWAKDNSTMEDGKEIKSVRKRLIECYKELYFESKPDLTPKENVNRIVRNMIQLTFDATLAELTSLEELMSFLMSDADGVHEDVIHKLWQVYSTPKSIPRAQRRGAIIILGMLAVPKPEVVSDHIEHVLRIGLGPLGKRDMVLAKFSCLALRRIGGSQRKVKGSLQDKNIRLPMDSPIFSALAGLIQHQTSSKDWFGMAEQAINTIYVLGDQPDALCSVLLKDMTRRVFCPPLPSDATETEPAPASASMSTDQEAKETPEDSVDDVSPSETQTTDSQSDSARQPLQSNAFQLAQLVFSAGHIAIKHLVHLELVEREYKRRKEVAAVANSDPSNANKKQGPKEQDELDQVAGSVEDEVADVIAETKERELLYGSESLLAVFGPMTVQICQYPKLYRNRTLRIAAVTSLCKFMCVSAKFCEDHLLMLFKIFETTSDPVVKSNIAIALGDIAVAFSTIMDDNSDRLYAGLASSDLNVKKNTLMVLTHLILNGMIKVKGQLGEMAKCLEDDDRRIKDLAKLFFSELATKDNAIYNNLPDIVSSLSSGAHKVNEAMFEKTMQFIFKFIDKEKQAEAIVEKLCQRFKFTSEGLDGLAPETRKEAEERRWRDIALCLSMLPYKSERSIKKLLDALPLYQDKLHEPTVYKRFNDILVKARTAKGKDDSLDYKDFEEALDVLRQKGQEDADTEKAVAKKKKTVAKRKAAAAPRAKGRAARRRVVDSDADEDSDA